MTHYRFGNDRGDKDLTSKPAYDNSRFSTLDPIAGRRGVESGTSDMKNIQKPTRIKRKGQVVGESRIQNGVVVADVLVENPRNPERPVVLMKDVKMTVPFGYHSGIKPGQEIEVDATNDDDIDFKRSEAVTARISERPMPKNNPALPNPVKIKNQMDSFADMPQAACDMVLESIFGKTKKAGASKRSELEQQSKEYMCETHNRDDLVMYGGNKDGRSPGMVVQQSSGTMYIHDGSGKNYIEVGPMGKKENTSASDTGCADRNRTSIATGGLPSTENPVLDIVPNGTILTPQPALLPDYKRIALLIFTIYDMIDLVKACGDAVKAIKQFKDGDTDAAQRFAESARSTANSGKSGELEREMSKSKSPSSEQIASDINTGYISGSRAAGEKSGGISEIAGLLKGK